MKALLMTNKSLDTPQGFFGSIPTDPAENISWRMTFHEKVAKDEGLQRVYKELCWKDMKILLIGTLIQ